MPVQIEPISQMSCEKSPETHPFLRAGPERGPSAKPRMLVGGARDPTRQHWGVASYALGDPALP
jgi:hypothetical protein